MLLFLKIKVTVKKAGSSPKATTQANKKTTSGTSGSAQKVIDQMTISVAEKYGVPCVWWDNGSNCSPKDGEGFALLNRKTCKWYYPELVKTLVNAVK